MKPSPCGHSEAVRFMVVNSIRALALGLIIVIAVGAGWYLAGPRQGGFDKTSFASGFEGRGDVQGPQSRYRDPARPERGPHPRGILKG